MADMKTLPKADQERWLEQRGWVPSTRTGVKMWRHPDTGLSYIHTLAIEKALNECRLPADSELNPTVPEPKREP